MGASAIRSLTDLSRRFGFQNANEKWIIAQPRLYEQVQVSCMLSRMVITANVTCRLLAAKPKSKLMPVHRVTSCHRAVTFC
ncbi:DNA polymerase zeta processivity subunit [Fusarium oxysporum f. sp. albedinis]|nr:DNA polymerase zeta processivity subunit [Fusarium oxysporum f. sp. albedinis]